METKTYIIRLPSDVERDAFVDALPKDLEYTVVTSGPVVIVRDVTEATLEEMRAAAPSAEFFENVQFQLV